MAESWLTDDQQRVWRNYLTMVSRLQTAMNRQLQRDCGLSLADYDVLVALSERQTMRIYELTDALGWEQSRLSHQLARMRARNLVVRCGSVDDRRGAIIEISAEGREALNAAAPGHVALVRSVVFDPMTQPQLRALDAVTTVALARISDLDWSSSRPARRGSERD